MKKKFSCFLVVILLLSISTACSKSMVENSDTSHPSDKYGYIYPSHDGIRKVMNTSDVSPVSKFGYIDEEGNAIAECKYDQVTDFVNGIGVLREGEVITAINAKGETIQTFDSGFSDIKYYDGSKGIARKDELDYLIDRDGKIISKEGYTNLFYDPFTWKNCILAMKDDLYGFIDWDGNILTPIEYRNISSNNDFSGIMQSERNGCYGFIASNGKVLVPALYKSGSIFKEGVGILWKNGKAAFISSDGEQITDFIYDNAQNFSEGLGNFMVGAKWGYIDKTGKEVIPAIYDNSAYFENGYANIQKADESWIKEESPIKKSRKINVYINDKWIYLDQEPVIENDTVLTPIRGIAESLDYIVTWDAVMNIATFQNDRTIIHLTAGSKAALVNTFDDGIPTKTVIQNIPATLMNGHILVSVKFIAENLGAEVTWNKNDKEISINTVE